MRKKIGTKTSGAAAQFVRDYVGGACCRVDEPIGGPSKSGICAKHKREGWREFECVGCSGTGKNPSDRHIWSRLHQKEILLTAKGSPCGRCGGTGKDLDTVRTDPCGCQRRFMAQWTLKLCKLHKIGPQACCLKAKRNNCVCMYSYKCPKHGETHIGTHD